MIAVERIDRRPRIELETVPKLQLLKAVRDTRTLDGGIPLYKDADISIKTFDPNDLYPTAKYVLTGNLRFIAAMRKEILWKGGVDIFGLDYIYTDSVYVVSPPVVEMSDGVTAIVDGLHRCALARLMRKQISVIFVAGVNPTYPLISTPVPWDNVIEYQTKPEIAELLRNVRTGIRDESSSLRRLYRDFGYLGSTGRKPRLGQNG